MASGRPRTAGLGIRVHVRLEAADSDDLVLRPDPDGEGAGVATEECEGAIVGPLQGADDAAAGVGGHGGDHHAAHLAADGRRCVC